MSMLPIRCIVETVLDAECLNCCNPNSPSLTVADAYAIVAGQTSLSHLVPTVLATLGLQHLSSGAKGMIQLNNWKPLLFEQITDDPDIEIGNLLKDVSNQSALKILTIKRSGARDFAKEMKDRLLKATVQKLPSFFTDMQEANLKEFVMRLVESSDPVDVVEPALLGMFNAWLDAWSSSDDVMKPTKPACSLPEVQQTTTRFSQLLEVPKMERWFRENPNPSRQKLTHYISMLNGSNFRKHTAKITYQQICNWFSNARATSIRRHFSSGRTTNASRNKHRKSSVSSQLTSDWRLDGGSVVNLKVVSVANPRIGNEFQLPANAEGNNYASVITRGPSAIVTQASMSLSNDSCVHDVRCSSTSDDTSSYTLGKEPTDDDRTPVCDAASTTLSEESSSSPSPVASALKSLTDALPGLTVGAAGTVIRCPAVSPSSSGLTRTRLMFDPLTELPVLEKWFDENPHPSWIQIDQYTDALNCLVYRKTYPSVSSHNVKIWFKNRRAKCKRRAFGDD